MQRAPLIVSFVAAMAGVFVCGSAPAAQERLQAAFDRQGLHSLKWDGQEVLKDGRPKMVRVVLEEKALNDAGINEYDWETLDGPDPKVAVERGDRRVKYSYPWGAATFDYAPRPDRLGITVTIENASDRTIADFDVRPLELRLPEGVEERKRWNRMVSMPDHVGVVEAAYGEEKLLLACETMGYLRFGLGRPREGRREMPVVLQGGLHMMKPGGVEYPLLGLPRVGPGERLEVRFSLRFAPADADTDGIVADVYDAFRAYHRPRLVWKDRRPVGAIFLPTGRGPAKNPRNWFKAKDLDIRTPEGREELRERMMDFADRCINTLQKTNAQGMIVWNPEGGENPHPITYIGDPRMVRLVAPEMEEIYPEFFRKFTEAGLRTGCCIRPTQVYMTPFTAACDGDPATRWSVQQFPQWLEVDLGAERMIDRTEIVCFKDRAYRYRIEAKPEGGEYKQIVDGTDNTTAGSAEGPITDAFEPVQARYVKLTITGAHGYDGKWCSIREFRIFAGQSKNLARDRAHDCSRRYGRTVGGHVGYHDPDRNPLGDDYGEIWPEGLPPEHFYPVVERMSRKIEFAKKNWGCTIFYVDTNGVRRPVGQEGRHKWTLLQSSVWRELVERHPDVLLIPEFAPNPAQLAYTGPYLQPPYSQPTTRPYRRMLFPGAFSVSYTVNLKAERWMELRDRLLRGVREGDSLFFRGWFGDRYNRMIKALYDEVYEPGAINPGLPASYGRGRDTQEP